MITTTSTHDKQEQNIKKLIQQTKNIIIFSVFLFFTKIERKKQTPTKIVNPPHE